MKIAIVSGSHRPQGQTLRVARVIEKILQERQHQVDLISLSGNPLPLWDEGVWGKTEAWSKVWGPVSEKLKSTEAHVVCTPEWAGMTPPGLRNFFLLCGNQELGHKPGLIVSVSSGTGGAYPVAELRASSTKNNHLCYIPEQVIVRHVEKNLLDPQKPSSTEDEIIWKRLHYSLAVLEKYAVALADVRKSGVIDHAGFANGM